MARIRSIKPEFWTDAKIVQLPYEARLLFIGLWNFCDDDGLLADEPEQLRLQILPADGEDVDSLLDLLCTVSLLERIETADGDRLICVSNFNRHQRISHKTPSRFSLAGAKKSSMSSHTPIRREVAIKYGCQPGKKHDASCYYCGASGSIHWWNLRNGRPSAWVTFSGLELDHMIPENSGGETKAENIVLACRYCNRSKGTKSAHTFILRNAPEDSGTLRPDRKGLDGIGGDQKGGEEEEAPAKPSPPPRKRFEKPSIQEIREYCEAINSPIKPAAFFNHYESKGWLVGKAPMKDWKAAVRGWTARES